MDYKNLFLSSMTGCPFPEKENCKPTGLRCQNCRREMLIEFVRDSCSGIVQTSTLNRIVKKAEKLLEES